MPYHWKILNRSLIFDGSPWLKIFKEMIQLPNGDFIKDFYQIEQPDYVEIVALNDKQQILGMWHYKHGVKKEHFGLPAGYLEKNEEPITAAKRELAEECQLKSNDWVKLGQFVLEGNRGPASAHIFMAKNCQDTNTQLMSDDIEPVQLVWMSIEDWFLQLKLGKVAIIGAATAILLTQLALTKKEIT